MKRASVAMTAGVEGELHRHLLRADGQEDVCLARYTPSTGAQRSTALVTEVEPPNDGERTVHGNAEFTGDYVRRVATIAAKHGQGVVILHSHPRGRGWQGAGRVDTATESSYAFLVTRLTGLPLVGMTLAGVDGAWSARCWDAPRHVTHCENVRVIGSTLRVSWNSDLRPIPVTTEAQVRTVSAWGESLQADMARLRVLVVGVGSVGMLLAQHLAATGFQHLAVMDFDRVETLNLDRLLGATRLDAALGRRKTDVALRLLRNAATAAEPDMIKFDLRITDHAGVLAALDYDVIFCCVDRPWPRAVLNQLAYSDLIPVIDGGIAIDAFDDGGGMRGATMRSHVLRPGRPCMSCNQQLELGDVTADRMGDLDDPKYIAGLPDAERGRQNVAILSATPMASMLAQFVSMVVAPGGRGEPGPLRYRLAIHDLEHPDYTTVSTCPVEAQLLRGDRRMDLAEDRPQAQPPAAASALRVARGLEDLAARLQRAALQVALRAR